MGQPDVQCHEHEQHSDHVEVRYGGNSSAGEVFDNGGPLSLTNSTVKASQTAGLRVEGAAPMVTNVLFQNNNGPAIGIDQASDVHTTAITATGNQTNAIAVDSGTLAASTSWTGHDIPFQLAGNVTIPTGLNVTIGAGATFEAVDFFNFVGAGSIINAGLIRKSSGNSSVGLAPAVTNTGTIKILSGTLNFQGGLTNSGAGAWLARSARRWQSPKI